MVQKLPSSCLVGLAASASPVMASRISEIIICNLSPAVKKEISRRLEAANCWQIYPVSGSASKRKDFIFLEGVSLDSPGLRLNDYPPSVVCWSPKLSLGLSSPSGANVIQDKAAR